MSIPRRAVETETESRLATRCRQISDNIACLASMDSRRRNSPWSPLPEAKTIVMFCSQDDV